MQDVAIGNNMAAWYIQEFLPDGVDYKLSKNAAIYIGDFSAGTEKQIYKGECYGDLCFYENDLFFNMGNKVAVYHINSGETEVLFKHSGIKKSGLEDRIKTLPHGADTYLYKEFDPDGIELSGGEGQKIAIARAVYRNAPIVIFDEPTSALDPIAEYNIYRNFHDLANGRTSIYISHRLSSTRFTDKIAVFANATIAEYGTHKELLDIDNGIYKKMFSMQAKYYEE